jgi:hypothetical protein
MATTVVVTESDYREIAKWDDEGGAACDVIYLIVPDRAEEAEELELALSAN